MAVDRRKCFLFGTEDRMVMFATPLQGADSSPSAWGVDGTLLNGGGYAFNSFGSHKRYTYEWPQSSSPEVAQMMKSYRDGTYGRGLLYFLEPGIYRTNILPAHWADPSMSINNEAPSLVYGVDPIAVPTSGGADLGLPVTSAQYDLSTVTPQSVATPDSSVFLPIPPGHTLLLGAFYSFTGTAGVFVTPINSNGTLGASVKLTDLNNSETNVVLDQFSGDIKGVRLWVSRSDSTASSITLTAMTGRLVETSDVPTYSAWTVQRTNLHPDPSMTSKTYVTETPAQATVSIVSPGLRWTIAATTAVGLNLTGNSLATGENARLLIHVRANRSLTASPRIRGTVVASGNVTLTTAWQWIDVTGVAGATAVNTGFLLASGAGHAVSDWIEIDQVLIARTPDVGDWYSGSSTTSDPLLQRNRWLGAANASESVQESRVQSGSSAKLDIISRGPWIGGQGHSGCRFLGTPSYVTNSPVEGGRVGFAASFAEVGSWVYG